MYFGIRKGAFLAIKGYTYTNFEGLHPDPQFRAQWQLATRLHSLVYGRTFDFSHYIPQINININININNLFIVVKRNKDSKITAN